MTRRGFLGACAAAVASMLMPAAKIAGLVEETWIWEPVPGTLKTVWRGRMVMVGLIQEPKKNWLMSSVVSLEW